MLPVRMKHGFDGRNGFSRILSLSPSVKIRLIRVIRASNLMLLPYPAIPPKLAGNKADRSSKIAQISPIKKICVICEIFDNNFYER